MNVRLILIRMTGAVACLSSAVAPASAQSVYGPGYAYGPPPGYAYGYSSYGHGYGPPRHRLGSDRAYHGNV